MYPDWKSHIDTLSPIAATSESLKAHRDDTLLVDLSDLGLIKATGSEWRSFLQGQLSSDLQQLSPQQSQLSSYNSPKGRIMALMRLIEAHDGVWLQLPQEILEPIQRRMSMFIMRADVAMDDESEAWVRFGVTGPQASAVLAPLVDNLPSQAGGVVSQDDLTVVLESGTPQPSYQLIASPTRAIELWQALATDYVVMGRAAWELQMIGAGLPAVYGTTQEAWVAQMVNLQLVGGVSFTKGCFTGQEVIARMQHLGTLKRQMYRAHIGAEVTPQVGDMLSSEHSQSGQGAGRVVRVAPSGDAGYEILAVMEIKAAEAGPVSLEGHPEATLELLPLPYPFAEPK